jgi:hypothetical protein
MASKTKPDTGSKLFLTALAKLQLSDGIDPASRNQIHDEMKTVSSVYKSNMQGNLTKIIKQLMDNGSINEPATGQFAFPGRRFLEQEGLISPGGILTPVTEQLDRYLLDVHDPHKASFIAEAVGCVKNKQPRAAIVLSWVGAVYLLYSHVIASRLNEFNTETRRRWPKIKDASDIDDLARMKESDFLSVIEHMKVINRAEGKELVGCLDRRNTAGHPNSHQFEEVTVGHHIQTLITAVYLKF